MPTMSSSPSDDRFERFRVEPWVDWFGGFVARRPRLWRRIGDLETRQFGRALDSIAIRAPLFVCGLARSGSTILLESLRSEEHTSELQSLMRISYAVLCVKKKKKRNKRKKTRKNKKYRC